MKISDIERAVGVTAGTVRHWEERGLLSAGRSDNRYRTYTQKDIEILSRIKVLREIGIAIADIKLWRDGVVDEKTLLISHRRQMDEADKESRRLRALCDRMIESPTHSAGELSVTPFCESDTAPPGKLLLGIDIGTTSISAQLIAQADGKPLHTYNIDHGAALPSDTVWGEDAFAADAEALVKTALGLIRSAVDSYPNIAAIGFAGQMHGIVCVDDAQTILSPLFTWQNAYGRRMLCGETVCDRIERITALRVPTGYGLVTYYALRAFGLLPTGTTHITTISDLIVARLCHTALCCHPTHAAAFGFFDLQNNTFDGQALARLQIETSILPQLTADHALAGYYQDIPVTVSIGDNQAGAYGALADEGDALLNIGTSGQISRIGNFPHTRSTQNSVEYRPYFHGKYLWSGSILSGGRALAMLASLVEEILAGFDVTPSRSDIYTAINRAALSCEPIGEAPPLRVDTAFGGTRDEPMRCGQIPGITPNNFTFAALASGFCHGIVDELYLLCRAFGGDMPKRLVIAGNALHRNAALRRAASTRFGCPLVVPAHREESAYGAALYAGVGAGLLQADEIRRLIRYESVDS